ncbi:MAG: ABC transporter ATP-binding protein [Trueperaceae bacterium]|nr:ABC transporter ATP-binding protein [Trueperaceae bacterium]
MKALEVKNLSAFYGKIQVLWDVSFEVEEGEFVTIIGANGAGKTTLLKSISGLISNKKGTVTAFGKSIEQLSAAKIVRSHIGHVPEGRQLFHLMTVLENLESGADYLPHAKREAAKTKAYVYSLFPRLKEREKQLAGTLSGGERQMLAIGRALMTKPKLLLVDEPSLGLAPALTKTVFQALKTINQEGVTIVLVEQNVLQSLKAAQRAYVLENGEVVKSAEASSLLNDPEIQAAYLAI